MCRTSAPPIQYSKDSHRHTHGVFSRINPCKFNPNPIGLCCHQYGLVTIKYKVNMTEVEPVLDFASSARTGRRNALPDILGSPAGVTPSDLPLKLAEMSLNTGPDLQSPSAESPQELTDSPELKDTS
uniref:cAMP-dependent protein kinase inhibitor beta n=1 Tax=Xenopus tropicalis TaxID=8364 RepID=A0A803JUA8_XENTR